MALAKGTVILVLLLAVAAALAFFWVNGAQPRPCGCPAWSRCRKCGWAPRSAAASAR